jgi:ketosteroid isomerase-like protein
MMAFVESWIAAWNRRDVDAVLAHYADDAQFVSPVARKSSAGPCCATRASWQATGGRRSSGSGRSS